MEVASIGAAAAAGEVMAVQVVGAKAGVVGPVRNVSRYLRISVIPHDILTAVAKCGQPGHWANGEYMGHVNATLVH